MWQQTDHRILEPSRVVLCLATSMAVKILAAALNRLGTRRSAVFVCAAVMSVSGPQSAGSEPMNICNARPRVAVPVMVGDAIRLEPLPGLDRTVLHDAISYWQACSGYGHRFPRIVTEGEGDIEIAVKLERRKPGNGHCATLAHTEIVLFTKVRTASGALVSCGNLEEKLAHELGHVLGLADLPRDGRCPEHLMAPIELSSLVRGSAVQRRAQPAECELASARWLTWSEVAGVGQQPEGSAQPATFPQPCVEPIGTGLAEVQSLSKENVQ
jgi:hypothetical protein